MSMPGKLLTATAAQVNTATLNVWGPRTDRLINAWPFAEAAGTEAANVGVGTTYGSDHIDMGVCSHQNTPSFVSAATDAVNGPYTFFETASSEHSQLWTQGAGGDVDMKRGTVMIRLRHDASDDSGVHHLLNSGSALSASGHFRLMRYYDVVAGGDIVRYTIRGAGGDLTTIETAALNWANWHTIISSWGERGMSLYVDTMDSVATDAATDYWSILASDVLRLFASHTGATTSDAACSALAIWDIQLEEREIEECLLDPWIVFRPAPDEDDYFSTDAGPIVGRDTTTGVTFRVTTGNGTAGNLADDAIGIKINYGEDKTSLASWSSESAVSATTDINQALDVELTGLGYGEGAEFFWRAYWSPQSDAGTPVWYPFPCGLGRMVLRRTTVPVGGYTFAIFTDCHIGAKSPDSAADGFGVRLYDPSTAQSQEKFTTWRSMHDLYTRSADWDIPQPDFTIHLGDMVQARGIGSSDDQSDTDTDKFVAYARCRSFRQLQWQMGAQYFVLGNHEGEYGHNVHGSASYNECAMQKQATVARKRYMLNPTNATYTEGGENEGSIGAPAAADPGLDWTPPDESPFSDHAGGLVGFLDDYMRDAAGENDTPLENYWAFTHGNALFVFLDVGRYSDPGQAGSTIGSTTSNQYETRFSLGATQKAWLESTLAASSADYKFVFAHHGLGGTNYGRESGLAITGSRGGVYAEEDDLQAVVTENEGTAIFKGHEHLFCNVRNIYSGLNYVTVPSGGTFVSFDETNYGTLASEGADLVSWGDGLGAAGGIVKTNRTFGYVVVHVESDSVTVYHRHVAVDEDASGDPTHNEHYLGEFIASAGEVASLQERPTDVTVGVTDDTWSDIADTDWWTGGIDEGTQDVLELGSQVYASDQDWTDEDVTLEAGTTGDVLIQYSPRWYGNAELLNTLPSGGGGQGGPGERTGHSISLGIGE
jgi:hypothetical protein